MIKIMLSNAKAINAAIEFIVAQAPKVPHSTTYFVVVGDDQSTKFLYTPEQRMFAEKIQQLNADPKDIAPCLYFKTHHNPKKFYLIKFLETNKNIKPTIISSLKHYHTAQENLIQDYYESFINN